MIRDCKRLLSIRISIQLRRTGTARCTYLTRSFKVRRRIPRSNRVEEYTVDLNGPNPTYSAAFSRLLLQYDNNTQNNHTVNWMGSTPRRPATIETISISALATVRLVITTTVAHRRPDAHLKIRTTSRVRCFASTSSVPTRTPATRSRIFLSPRQTRFPRITWRTPAHRFRVSAKCI